MMEGLLRMEPSVRMFYGTPSTYLWEDEMIVTRAFHREREGSKATPSCPYFSHWDSTKPLSRHKQGWGTEKVMAFLDDIVISTPEPDRVTEAHTIVAE